MSKYRNHGFFDISDGVFNGKGVSALLDSRARRDELIALFGGKENLPSSVMRAKRARDFGDSDAPTQNGRKYSDTGRIARGTYATENKELQKAFKSSGGGATAGALSIFPQNIGKTVVTLYSDPGDIVFDPFAGHNSRMELCVSNGRHYIGYDISKEFMKFNRRRAVELFEYFPSAKIQLYLQDSRVCMHTPDNVGDFTLTSPPYYDIEEYGDEPEQMGKAKTYDDFLASLYLAVEENFRCLKPGKYAVWFVNDFRRNKKFHMYHADLCELAKEAGFEIHDIMIVDFGNGIGDTFINQFVQRKIIPKRHEYGLVFKKPE